MFGCVTRPPFCRRTNSVEPLIRHRHPVISGRSVVLGPWIGEKPKPWVRRLPVLGAVVVFGDLSFGDILVRDPHKKFSTVATPYSSRTSRLHA